MRENLSAPGTLDDWMTASEDALWNAGFDNVGFDPDIDRLYGDYGAHEYIDIDFSVPQSGRVRLEIEASNRALIEKYKRSVTVEIRRRQNRPATDSGQTENYTSGRSEDYDDDTAADVPRQPAFRIPDRLEDKIPRDSRGVPIYAKTWFVILALILVPPLGIFLLFFCRKFRLIPRIVTAFVALMYTLLIWVGFFGVNTGFNRDTINMWYKDAQSQITRTLHQKDENAVPQSTPTPTASDTDSYSDESTSTDASGATEVPVNQGGDTQDSSQDQGVIDRILETFRGQ